jgi:hypothetical protein
MKYEGFWRKTEAEDSKLPWPQPASSWSGRERFLAHLSAVESEAQSLASVVDFMGHSTCRLCGKQNGASEYTVEHWTWPEGFQHYVLEHGVRPSPHFERFILEKGRS